MGRTRPRRKQVKRVCIPSRKALAIPGTETGWHTTHLVNAEQIRFDISPQESHILDEVIPFVEGMYRVDRRRERRAITGWSKGGGEAFLLGLKHDDMFSVVGLLAPLLGINKNHDQSVESHDAARYPLELWMWYSTADPVLPLASFEAGVAFMEDHQLAPTVRVTAGAHFPTLVDRELLLTFASDHLGPPVVSPTSVSPAGKLSAGWAALKSDM